MISCVCVCVLVWGFLRIHITNPKKRNGRMKKKMKGKKKKQEKKEKRDTHNQTSNTWDHLT